MRKNTTSLLVGMAAGIAIGILGYKFSKSEKAGELKDNAHRAWLKTRIKARKAYHRAKTQASAALADSAHTIAEKIAERQSCTNGDRNNVAKQ